MGRIEKEIFMNQNKESFFDNNNNSDVVNRYHEMVLSGKKSFFDVHEFEQLIEYFLQKDDLANAFKITNLAIRQHPDSTILIIRKAQVLIDKGNFQEALNVLNSLEEYDTSNNDLFLLKGIAFNFTGQIEEAKNCFIRALNTNCENRTDTLFSIAVNYENVNDLNTAINYLLEAYKEEKNNLLILLELGYCFNRLDNSVNAIKYYNEYLDINPFSDLVWFNLGVIYSNNYNFIKAIEAYDYTLTLNSEYALAYYNKGNALANSGKYEEAIIEYKEYLAFEDNHTETLCFIGECYERLNKIDLAFEYYHKSLSINPEYPDAIYGIAILYSMSENYPESINLINKAITINPNCSDYWYSLGNIYLKLNITEKAVEAFRLSTEIDPYDYESWLNLSDLFFKKNLLTKAIKTLEDAHIFNPDIALVNYRLAAYNLLKNNITEGVMYFKNGIKINFEEYKELLKYFPGAIEINEINDLINSFKSIKQ